MARLHRDVLDALLDRIVDGRYAAGEMLPKEERLVDEFGVSRGTAREALRALEERGVARVKHGRGATVQPPEAWNVLDPIVARALLRGRTRRAFLRELRAYRALLEPEAAAQAAAHATARQRAELRTLAEADDAARIRELVAVAAGNRPLASTLRALADSHEPRTGGDYAALATAVADGDENAARAAAARLSG